MIKTLRITGAVTALLAIIFFIFLIVFGVRPDEEAEKFLSEPSAIEKFKQANGSAKDNNSGQVSPLVRQAETFGLYLNPPAPLKPVNSEKNTPIPQLRPEKVTAQFKLVGTSVHDKNPELSLAFIDEPGRGLYWVRPGGVMGHLILEEVKDGAIVIRDGSRTYEKQVEPRLLQRSLLEGSSPAAASTISPEPALPPDLKKSDDNTKVEASMPLTSRINPEENAALESLVVKLKNLQKSSSSDKNNSGQADNAKAIDKLISDLNSKGKKK